jgi:CRISPR-associated protein Cmr6
MTRTEYRSGQGSGSQPPAPPWLNPAISPETINTASFVEYLRWMRSPNSPNKDITKLELISKFESNDFSAALNRLTERTKRLAEQWFEAVCPWRIRVGGSKGPESMLLPAFDALGMPYIPSSTLRGIARAIASRKCSAEELKKIFGDIEPESSMGQVTFLDAYPLPGRNNQGGLKPDIANAIWKWQDENPPQYKTNPNIFLSLEKPTFVVGLCKGLGCTDETFNQVKQWLFNGLAQGIGAQVNSGYGTLDSKVQKPVKKLTILSVKFTLEGQLIHGRQKFNPQGRGIPEAEVRPIAFRSALRYWLRAFALGALSPSAVRDLELEIFGGIEPKPHTGLFRLEIVGKIERDNAQRRDDNCGKISGTLTLRNSSQTASLEESRSIALTEMLKNLTWLMFHLGGVGQGARRPCYSRQNREWAPWWRGASLSPDSEENFWGLPEKPASFQKLFRERLKGFYKALEKFSGQTLSLNAPRSVLNPTSQKWAEAVDAYCKIICVSGEAKNGKPFALAVLHSPELKKGSHYDPDLCGKVQGGPIPSPVWIADLGDYQVVTIFGATQDPRRKYVGAFREDQMVQLWPL